MGWLRIGYIHNIVPYSIFQVVNVEKKLIPYIIICANIAILCEILFITNTLKMENEERLFRV